MVQEILKGDKCLEDEEHSGQPLEVDNNQLRAIIEADPLLTTTTQEVAKEQCQLFYHRLTLEANWKGEKLDKCVPCKLTTNQKKWSFWSVISYSTQLQQTISQSDYDVQWKMDIVRQSATTTSVVGLRSSSALPKAKLAPKKGRAHCLVVFCLSDPLELSESWWNHYSWEVCSADQWDTLKTAIPAAALVNRKGPILLYNSAQLHVTQPMLQKLTNWTMKFCLIHRNSPDLSTTTTSLSILKLFVEKMLPQPAGGRKCFPRDHWFTRHAFLRHRNKQT